MSAYFCDGSSWRISVMILMRRLAYEASEARHAGRVAGEARGQNLDGGSFRPIAPQFRFARVPYTRALRLQTGCLQEPDDFGIEFRIVVQDDITKRT
jgi:hypothetical protein